jgi:hypothetical protein
MYTNACEFDDMILKLDAAASESIQKQDEEIAKLREVVRNMEDDHMSRKLQSSGK